MVRPESLADGIHLGHKASNCEIVLIKHTELEPPVTFSRYGVLADHPSPGFDVLNLILLQE